MAAIDSAMVSKILNATTSITAFSTLTTAMKVKLNSTLSTAAAMGTELSGTGYTAGGQVITFTTSATGSAVTGPTGSALSWTNGSGGNWTVVSWDLTDSAATAVRTWWGPFTGQPITVANGNVFQVAVNAISITLT
jgi:hypothetical protein